MKIIKQFLNDTKYLRKRYLITSVISLIIVFVGVVIPLITQKIIDQGIFQKNINKLILFLGINFFLVVLQAIATYIVNIQYAILCKEYNITTKEKVLKALQKFSGQDIQEIKSGKLINILEEDIDDISVTLTDKIFELFSDIFSAVFSFIILIFMAPSILFLVLIIQIVLFVINRTLANKIEYLNNKYFKLKDIQCSNVQEYIENLDYLIQDNIVSYFIKKFVKKEEELNSTMYGINRIMAINFSSQSILNTCSKTFIWGIGGVLVILKRMTMGELYAIELYASRFFSPIYRIIDNNLEIKKTLLQIERIYSLLNNCFENDNGKDEIENLGNSNIYFQNVDFAYGKETVFSDFNLTITKNDVNVIMGKSGQGKTTIIKLITQLWKIDTGKVLIGDRSIYDYSKKSLREHLSIVSQTVPIFNATIYENMVLDNKTNFEDVISICKVVGIYNEILQMKNGFDTMISEYGKNLSGGQKQRIAVVRAILKKSDVIIFDEPTASLDLENKIKIKNLIYNLKNKTIILITHDKELINDTQQTHVICNGKII